MPETGIIILAAGNSSRLGRPKQLLSYEGGTLIGYLADEAAAAGLQPVVVVTGAVDLSAALADRRVEIVENTAWAAGMGSSIVAGISAVMGSEVRGNDSMIGQEVDAVIIAACDQPHVTAALFRRLIAARVETGRGIVACSYAGTTGIPVLFDRRYFPDLLALSGAEGAKKVVQCFASDMAQVNFEEGAFDIDTEEDYARLLGV
ncbi:MAG TPA: nucleotidyltransferase family protein [Puia sp.]|nr:nucleotidyltransferase family protein [Puia sp.]